MRLLTASALALTFASTGAMGSSHTSLTDGLTNGDMMAMRDNLIRTRDITGGDIYSMNEAHDDWDINTGYEGVGADWNDIGEIEDVVLDKKGQMIGIVAEVGGFLDIGDKHVMIPINDVRLVPVDDRSYALVTRYSKEELEAMESVDEGFWN